MSYSDYYEKGYNKQNNLQDDVSLSKIPEKAPAARLSKENGPNTILHGTSIAKGIGNVLGL